MTFDFYDALKETKNAKEAGLTTENMFYKICEVMKADPHISASLKILDYFIPDRNPSMIVEEMRPLAFTNSGSEGCYVNLYLIQEGRLYDVGTMKTLLEGIEAWRLMGLLAGEWSFLAEEYLNSNF